MNVYEKVCELLPAAADLVAETRGYDIDEPLAEAERQMAELARNLVLEAGLDPNEYQFSPPYDTNRNGWLVEL